MSGLSVRLHDCIENNNILKEPTTCFADFFKRNPNLYKVALVINHLFRVAMMVGFMFIPGIPMAAKMAVCFAGSLFYRLTVETNCAYKFALPAFAGAMSVMLAVSAILSIINGVAFTSALSGFLVCVSFIPLPLYVAYVLLTVNYDVNDKMPPPKKEPTKSCCKVEKKEELNENSCHCN